MEPLLNRAFTGTLLALAVTSTEKSLFPWSRLIGSDCYSSGSWRPSWLPRQLGTLHPGGCAHVKEPGIWNFTALRCEQERKGARNPLQARRVGKDGATFETKLEQPGSREAVAVKDRKLAIKREKCCKRCKIPDRKEPMYLNFMLAKRRKQLGGRNVKSLQNTPCRRHAATMNPRIYRCQFR